MYLCSFSMSSNPKFERAASSSQRPSITENVSTGSTRPRRQRAVAAIYNEKAKFESMGAEFEDDPDVEKESDGDFKPQKKGLSKEGGSQGRSSSIV